MNKVRVVAAAAGLVAVLGLACSNGQAATVSETPAEPTAGVAVAPPLGAPAASPGTPVGGAPVTVSGTPAEYTTL